ncbi:MAG: ABC transporter permease [Candidatus Nanopelagicales bacterium]|jgi:NitT/TauT family transport system permease protein|nr:ABC transporter permease [Candidatus Nanopelagicales bacterium]
MSTVLTPVVEVPAPARPGAGLPGRAWAWAWPKLLAIGLVLAVWEALVWTGWRPEYVLPGPATVLAALAEMLGTPKFWQAVATTLTRAVIGFAVALVVGTLVGILVARIRPLRLAVGALITGLQTMPSISWFPLAILLFGLNERAIMFVVVLGAAPSIANGVISGIDHVPPAFTRLGRVLGAGPLAQYRFITLPAALPAYVAGLTQGWAFAWRSLMAGELLVIIAGRPSLGANLEFARQFSQADRLLATMLVVLVIGMVVDGVFAAASRRIRRRWGLSEA